MSGISSRPFWPIPNGYRVRIRGTPRRRLVRETRMLDKTDDISLAVDNWLTQFEAALATPDDGALDALFHQDSYWRDVLALSWNIQTTNGADAILKELKTHARRAVPSAFAIDPDRRPPRK